MTYRKVRRWGKVQLDPTNDFTRRVFTQGECGMLARALNHLVGAPIVLTNGHAAVIAPNGKILDIEGVHSVKKFEKRWGRIDDVVDPNDTSFNHFNECASIKWVDAIPYAKKVIDVYGPTCGLE